MPLKDKPPEDKPLEDKPLEDKLVLLSNFHSFASMLWDNNFIDHDRFVVKALVNAFEIDHPPCEVGSYLHRIGFWAEKDRFGKLRGQIANNSNAAATGTGTDTTPKIEPYPCGPLYSQVMGQDVGTLSGVVDARRWNWWLARYVKLAREWEISEYVLQAEGTENEKLPIEQPSPLFTNRETTITIKMEE